MQWKNILTSSDRVKSETWRGIKHWEISPIARLISNLYRFKRIYPGKLPYENSARLWSRCQKKKKKPKEKEERKKGGKNKRESRIFKSEATLRNSSPPDSYRRLVYARCDCVGRRKSVLVVRESRRSHQNSECTR